MKKPQYVILSDEKYAATVRGAYFIPLVVPATEIIFNRYSQMKPFVVQWKEGTYDWVVLTSQNTIKALQGMLSFMPVHTKVAAIGPKTAQISEKELGKAVDFVPTIHSTAGFLKNNPVKGRVFLPQSEISTHEMAHGLAQQGCTVDRVVAYTSRIIKSSAVHVHAARLVEQGCVRAIFLSSPSVVTSYINFLEVHHRLVTVICIGETTAQAVQQLLPHVEIATTYQLKEALLSLLPI